MQSGARELMIDFFAKFGRSARYSVGRLGLFGKFLGKTLLYIFVPPIKLDRIINRINFIGTKSLWLIILISAFTGAVMGLHGQHTLAQFGASGRVGTLVSLALLRELGPVVCAIMVAGRAGSSIASELGVMQITEQFDALKIMNLNPFRYFMAPIFVASLISVVLLTGIFNFVGIFAGYFVTGGLLGVSYGSYFGGVIDFVIFNDILYGSIKAFVFGGIVAWVSTYKGFYTGRGAEGVGRASTEAVVLSSVLILVSNYIMTSLMF